MRRVGKCSFKVDERERVVLTQFHDVQTDEVFAELRAKPNLREEDLARAEALGYEHSADGVWEMTLDHDYTHTLLAESQGLPWSPTLYGVATGNPIEESMAIEEERIVFLIQRINRIGLENV